MSNEFNVNLRFTRTFYPIVCHQGPQTNRINLSPSTLDYRVCGTLILTLFLYFYESFPKGKAYLINIHGNTILKGCVSQYSMYVTYKFQKKL